LEGKRIKSASKCLLNDVPLPQLKRNIVYTSRKIQGKGPVLPIELSKFVTIFPFSN
jgi:hypothetical protein